MAEELAEGDNAWTQAIGLDRLRASGRATVKLGAKQIALFLHEGESTPATTAARTKAIRWSKARSTPGLRTHLPLAQLEVRPHDRRRPSTAATTCASIRSRSTGWRGLGRRARSAGATSASQRALAHLDAAMADYDMPRIARELARLAPAGAAPELALARAIERNARAAARRHDARLRRCRGLAAPARHAGWRGRSAWPAPPRRSRTSPTTRCASRRSPSRWRRRPSRTATLGRGGLCSPPSKRRTKPGRRRCSSARWSARASASPISSPRSPRPRSPTTTTSATR